MKTKFLSDNIKPILALLVVITGFSYFYMCSIRNIKPDPQIVIAFVSSISMCLGYYFGSSSSSAKKDETIQAQSVIPTMPVTGDNPTVNVDTKPPTE